MAKRYPTYTRRRLAFKYKVRRFFLCVLALSLVALPVWYFAAKPQIPWPFSKDADDEPDSSRMEAVPAAAHSFDGEPEHMDIKPRQAEVEPEDSPGPESPAEPKVTPPQDESKSWALVLVNKENFLPEGYDSALELATITDDYRVDARISDNVRRMIADARNDGVTLSIISAYRSVERQTELYADKVEEFINTGQDTNAAQAAAATIVARPGTSEHHTGLALDFVTPSYTTLDEGFESTPAFKWLDKNAHRYGFVLRYPKDKQDITGIIYEPWHYRFVGEEHAAQMKEQDLCLEEYLEALRVARIKAAEAAAAEDDDGDGGEPEE